MEDDFDYLDDIYLDDDHGVGASGGPSGDGGWFGPWEAGAAFALAGWLMDKHAEKTTRGHGQGEDKDVHVDVHVHPEPEPKPKLINAAEGKRSPKWDTFFGQEPMKLQMRVHIDSAKARGVALDHTLLASGMPGAGKTTLARIIADEMGGEFIMLVPPFHVDTLNEAAMRLGDGGILFIDEALALDTPLPTPTGWTTVGEIQPGDQILGTAGPVTVLRLTETAHNHPTYRITFDDGESIVADAGHKWLAAPRIKGGTGYLDPRTVTTKDFLTGSWRIPLAGPINLPEADLAVDPYVLGQWLGNGNSGQGYINVRPELVDATTRIFELAGEQVTNLGPVGSLIRLSLNDARPGDHNRSSFRNRMEAMGIYFDKAIHPAYLRGSIRQRLRLVQGLMDTDGYVSPAGNCTFSTTTEYLADGMVELLRSLGYTPRKHLTSDSRIGAKGAHRPCWKVEFRGRPEVNPFLLRDADKVKPRKHKNMRRIVGVELVDPVSVRCLEVDASDHLFLAGRNWTITSNCHKLADHGKSAAENLLHMLEERRLYLDRGVVELNDITVIGATTDADKLPETIIDRFPIKPFFQPYSIIELGEITARFQGLEGIHLPLETTLGIAQACRRTPRVARELVVAARDLSHTLGRAPTIEELLDFKETDPNGMTRQHKAYITTLYEFFKRVTADGEVVYVAGEYAMRSILRETRDGLYRLERFLMEQGFLDRTPSGRRLSQRGIQAARQYIAERPRKDVVA